jgi:hypothetical protein
MKQFLFLVLMVSSTAYGFEDNPVMPFSTAKNIAVQSNIRWIPVNDVQEACNKESRHRGGSGFKIPVQACSFNDAPVNGVNNCIIYTFKNPTMHTLGHETRHCFQGAWHK